MTIQPFNSFLGALQSAVGQAQGAASMRHRSVVERMVEVDQDGKLRSKGWSIHLPDFSARADRAGAVVLPLLSLRPFFLPQVTGFKLEVTVTVEQERMRYPSGLQMSSLVIPTHVRGSSHDLRRLRVELRGSQPGAGEVRLDGWMLRRFEGSQAPPPPTDRLPPAHSSSQRLLELLRLLVPAWRGPLRFGLSEEDSRRVRDIQSASRGRL